MIALTLCLFLLFYFYCRRRLNYWNDRNVPNLKPRTPLGDLMFCVRKRRSVHDLLVHVYKKFKAEGHRYAGFYFTLGPVFIPIDYDLIKRILVNDYDYFSDRIERVDMKRMPLGDNVFSVENVRWKYLRDHVNGILATNKLKRMEPIIKHYVRNVREYVDRNASASIDISDLAFKYTLDIASNAFLGLDERIIEGNKPPVYDYIKQFNATKLKNLIKVALVYGTTRITNIILALIWDDDIQQFVHDYTQKVYDLRKSSNVKRDDALQELMRLYEDDEEPFDFHTLAGYVIVLLDGTVETTSLTISYVLYELAKSEESQARIREEVRRLLRREGGIDFSAISELEFLDCFVLETMRYHPIFSSINRLCVANYNVPNSELVIEKGTSVLVPSMAVHYDEEIFEDPQEFRPERFIDNSRAKQNLFTFSFGPKHCPGKRLASMIMKTLIVDVLMDYEIKLDPRTPEKLSASAYTEHIIYKYKDTILLRLRKKPLCV